MAVTSFLIFQRPDDVLDFHKIEIKIFFNFMLQAITIIFALLLQER